MSLDKECALSWDVSVLEYMNSKNFEWDENICIDAALVPDASVIQFFYNKGFGLCSDTMLGACCLGNAQHGERLSIRPTRLFGVHAMTLTGQLVDNGCITYTRMVTFIDAAREVSEWNMDEVKKLID